MPLDLNDPLIRQQLAQLKLTNPMLYAKIIQAQSQGAGNAPIFNNASTLGKVGNTALGMTRGGQAISNGIRRYRGMNDPNQVGAGQLDTLPRDTVQSDPNLVNRGIKGTWNPDNNEEESF